MVMTRLELLTERRMSFINELIELNIFLDQKDLTEVQRTSLQTRLDEVTQVLDGLDVKINKLKEEA